jgi:protein-S-isoprenylcysteine O-methyltransferase Ste14
MAKRDKSTAGLKLFLQRGGLAKVAQALGGILAVDALLFLIAGRLDWAAAWLLSALYLLGLLAMLVWSTLRDPGLLAERSTSRRQANVKSWDRVILNVYTVFLVALLVVPGLDARFHWSHVPWWVQALGFLAMIPAALLIGGAVRANTYLSSRVRIQEERGQHVVDTGPYRTVRHPMYVGLFFFVLGIPLALGSWWGLLPAAVIVALFILRTALEDRTLQAELPGYREYAQRVRYRLFPGIW